MYSPFLHYQSRAAGKQKDRSGGFIRKELYFCFRMGGTPIQPQTYDAKAAYSLQSRRSVACSSGRKEVQGSGQIRRIYPQGAVFLLSDGRDAHTATDI